MKGMKSRINGSDTNGRTRSSRISESPTPASGHRAGQEKRFAQFDRKRVGVVLMRGGKSMMFCGTSAFTEDEVLGPVLRIALEPSGAGGETTVLIAEREWQGRIVPDGLYGLDHFFILGNDPRAAGCA